ncbi:MAG: glycosyltransferase [Pseudoclavibacter sp.]
MSDLPLISVIIPVFHTAPQILSRCLESVSAQSDDIRLECIIVFDGQPSSDLQKVVSHCELGLMRVETIAHAGVSCARNKGLSVASGEWICFLDADDRLSTHGLRVLTQYGADHRCQIIQGGYRTVLATSSEVHRFATTESLLVGDAILTFRRAVLQPDSGASAVWSKLFRRSFLCQNTISFNERLRLGEDTLFVFQASTRAAAIGCVPEIVYEYIRSSKSAVRSFKDSYPADVEDSMCAMNHQVRSNPDADLFRDAFERYVLFHALLVQMHFVFNDQAPWQEQQRRARYRELTHNREVSRYLTWKNIFSFPVPKAISLIALKFTFYRLSRAISNVRRRQLSQ